jgi:hypothetical protein
MNEPSPVWCPLIDLSLWDRGLGRDASRDSDGSRPEEAPVAARVGEGGAPPIPGEFCVSFGLGASKVLA